MSNASANPALSRDLAGDIEAVAGISVLPTIMDVILRTTGMGFAAVARVTEERWIACSVRDEIDFGLKPGSELQVETTICNEIRESHESVIIEQVTTDDRFCGHPTPAMYGFESYISVPILLQDGEFFGTLCAIDPRPAKLQNKRVVGMFELFASLIAFHLDAHFKLESSEAVLQEERQTAELREQFIAVLGHDLRNPLSAISAGTAVIQNIHKDARTQQIVGKLNNSVQRIAQLIDNVVDFAHGRLGQGVPLDQAAPTRLKPLIEQVIDELRIANPDAGIQLKLEIEDDRRCHCDAGRIQQLISNLVANALTHGSPDEPVVVHAYEKDCRLDLSIINKGEPIPKDVMPRIFEPFHRVRARPSRQGLGLGLYIAMEITKAHNGTLTATSTPEETRFTVRLPLENVTPIRK